MEDFRGTYKKTNHARRCCRRLNASPSGAETPKSKEEKRTNNTQGSYLGEGIKWLGNYRGKKPYSLASAGGVEGERAGTRKES